MPKPNILITGTPGVGKTTVSAKVSELKGYEHVKISELVVEKKLYEKYDEKRSTHVIDEKKLLKFLKPMMEEGGKIVDHHCVEMYPEEWFSLCVVLRTSTQFQYDRLKARGYSEKKVQENVEAEIFGILEEEAYDCFQDTKTKVLVLQNDTDSDLENNTATICQEITKLE